MLRLEVERSADAPNRALAESTDSSGGGTETLKTTAEHPFWVRHDGWKPAGELEPGDEVYTSRGGWLQVTSGTWLAERRTVHNLEVAGRHTYFVGEVGVWVHNACNKNLNPFDGPVDDDVFAVDEAGNAIPVKRGQRLEGSSDSKWLQVREGDEATGLRKDGGHSSHQAESAQRPHAHRPEHGDHLPINE